MLAMNVLKLFKAIGIDHDLGAYSADVIAGKQGSQQLI